MLRSTSDFIADEDYGIIAAVVENLVQNVKTFTIKLPHEAYLTNQKDQVSFAFSGIDAIKDMVAKMQAIAPPFMEYEIIMPTKAYRKRTNVGRLFDLDVIADPNGQADNISMRPKMP